MKKSDIYFYVLIRSYKSLQFFDRCIDSVLSQRYKRFKIIFVDDNSGYSDKTKKYIKEKLKGHIVIFNKTRKYSVRNAYTTLHKYAKLSEAVVFNLDGDDWMVDNNTLLEISKVYKKDKNCWMTYGDCLLWSEDGLSKKPSRYYIPYTNIPYNLSVINKKSYRLEPFLPLHPRTWKVWLFKRIKKSDLQNSDGNWLRFAEDLALFYPMLEMSNGNFRCLQSAFSVYNQRNVQNDLKVNTINLLKDELIIRKKRIYETVKK